jgi:hypothetical protein
MTIHPDLIAFWCGFDFEVPMAGVPTTDRNFKVAALDACNDDPKRAAVKDNFHCALAIAGKCSM